jgi:hypothetical protein
MPPRDTLQRRAAAWRRASMAIDRMAHAKTEIEKQAARRWATAWAAIARSQKYRPNWTAARKYRRS